MMMVNTKEKDKANDDAARTSLTETTVSSPINKNLEDIVVVSENEKVEKLMEEVESGENVTIVMKNGENAIKEKNGENAVEAEEKNEENAIEAVENSEENAIEEDDDEENASKEERNGEKVETNSKKVKKSRKRNRRKKVAQGGSDKVETKDKDKPESSGNRKASKRADSMGMIFMCSSKTKKDCYRYKVLGLPANKRDIVEKVYKGMRLFLFDFDLRMMYGIYKAVGPGGYNIEPKAFKSAFPSQVRFTVLEDCLPLAEEKFKMVIKDNYYTRNKFDCQLTSEQVKKLCKLFIAASRGPKSKNKDRSRAETRRSVDRGRIRRRDRDEDGRYELARERRYHVRPVVYEKEVLTSPLAPLARVPPLPPPAPAPLYTYERTMAINAYRRDPVVEHRDLRLLDLESQRRDEVGSLDPYISYGGPSPYPYPADSAVLQPEYHTPAGLPPEYRYVGPPTEYRSSAGLQPEYRYVGPPTEYRSSAGTLPDYYTRRPLYRY